MLHLAQLFGRDILDQTCKKLVSHVEGKTACRSSVHQQRSKDEQVRSRRCAARIWVLKLLTELGPPLLRALWGTIADWIEERQTTRVPQLLLGVQQHCCRRVVHARCALVFELFGSGRSGETGTRTQSSVCGTPPKRAVYVLSLLYSLAVSGGFWRRMRLTSICDTRQDIPYLVPGPSYLHTVSDTGTSYWYVHIPCQHVRNTYVPGMSSTLAGNIIRVSSRI